MKHAPKVALTVAPAVASTGARASWPALAALLSALSCMACCLPFGFAAAAGAAGLSVVLAPLRPWMMAISGALLIFGVWQLYRSRGTCQRRSRFSLAVFWVSTVLVLAMMFMPQVVASLLADRLPG